MKSWISFLLPNDEYKMEKFLYFLSEGAIILILSHISMIMYNNYFQITVANALWMSIAIFIFYVTTRYILSGIEYTNLTTKQAYKKELRVIIIKIATFIITFILAMSVYLLSVGLDKWFELFSLTLGASLVWFLASFISLKRSYNKNKELL